MSKKLLEQEIVGRASKILVVDDKPATRNLICRFFRQKNYQTESAFDGKTAISVFEQFHPDLVILEVNLPDTTGYRLCQEMQSRTNVFVLLLTSRSDLEDKVTGFQMGADDYVTKPFDLEELQHRVKAILRRQETIANTHTQHLVFDQLAIDPMSQQVTLNDEPLILTALEFKLLHFLASHPNRTWRRSELIQHIWGYKDVSLRLVDAFIGRIRQKIESYAPELSFIQTVRAVGYKFEVPYKAERRVSVTPITSVRRIAPGSSECQNVSSSSSRFKQLAGNCEGVALGIR